MSTMPRPPLPQHKRTTGRSLRLHWTAVLMAVSLLGGCAEAPPPAEPPTPPIGPTAPLATPSIDLSIPATPSPNPSPLLRGSAPAGTLVTLFATAGCTGAPVAQGTAEDFSGAGIAVSVTPNATTTFSARASDETGRASECSEPFSFLHDDIAPAAPRDLSSTPASPAQEVSPFIRGSAEPETQVRLFPTPECSGSPLVTGSAATFASGFRIQVRTNTDTTLSADATDAAGNRSACSQPMVYSHTDATPPPPLAAPAGLTTAPASPSADPAPRLMGTAPAESAVIVYPSANCTGTSLATGSAEAFRSAGILLGGLAANAATHLSAIARGGDGRQSPCSAPILYVHDDRAPTPPSGFVFTPASPSDDSTPELRGAAEAGSTIRIYRTDDCSGSYLTVTAESLLSGQPVATQRNAITLFSATATDAAGNTSSCSSAVSYLHDDLPPSVAGAEVRDGLADDVDLQSSITSIEASWSGFSDATAIAFYEHSISTTPSCPGTRTSNVGSNLAVTSTGLALRDGEEYFNCVRAIDTVGNASEWVVSDGVLINQAPPSVISTTPADGAVRVRLTSTVSASLSELLDPESIGSTTLTLSGSGSATLGAVTYDPGQRSITFTPREPLLPGVTYTATLSGTIHDLAGMPMGADHQWSFIAEPEGWGHTRLVTERTGQIDLAMDGSGNAVLVWGQDTVGQMMAQRYTPDAGWQAAPVQVNESSDWTGDPKVSMNAKGDAIIIWSQRRSVFDNRQLPWFARSTPGSNEWSAPAIVDEMSSDLGEWTNDISLEFDSGLVALDAAGRAILTSRWSSTSSVALFTHRLEQGTWTRQRYTAEAQTLGLMDLAVSPSGHAALTGTSTAFGSRVWVRRAEPGGTWNITHNVNPELSWIDQLESRVAIDDRGNMLVVWHQEALRARRYVAGGGWEEPVVIGAPEPENILLGLRLAVSRDRVAVAWQGQSPEGEEGTAIWMVRYDADSGWSEQQRVDAPSSSQTAALVTSTMPQVVIDTQGRILVMWAQYDHPQVGIWARRHFPASGWQDPRLLHSAPSTRGYPEATHAQLKVVADARGNALATWVRTSIETGRGIWSAPFYVAP